MKTNFAKFLLLLLVTAAATLWQGCTNSRRGQTSSLDEQRARAVTDDRSTWMDNTRAY